MRKVDLKEVLGARRARIPEDAHPAPDRFADDKLPFSVHGGVFYQRAVSSMQRGLGGERDLQGARAALGSTDVEGKRHGAGSYQPSSAPTRLAAATIGFIPAMLTVPIRLLPHAVGLPAAATAGAAGLDLAAAVPEDAPMVLAPGARALVPTGVVLALPEGTEAQVRPRSGLAARHGVTVLNAPGTVDADYRGEVMVILVNHGTEPFDVRRGERIAQLVVATVTAVRLVPVEALEETARGDGGFGSTGL